MEKVVLPELWCGRGAGLNDRRICRIGSRVDRWRAAGVCTGVAGIREWCRGDVIRFFPRGRVDKIGDSAGGKPKKKKETKEWEEETLLHR